MEWDKIFSNHIVSDKNVERREPLYTVDENVNW